MKSFYWLCPGCAYSPQPVEINDIYGDEQTATETSVHMTIQRTYVQPNASLLTSLWVNNNAARWYCVECGRYPHGHRLTLFS